MSRWSWSVLIWLESFQPNEGAPSSYPCTCRPQSPNTPPYRPHLSRKHQQTTILSIPEWVIVLYNNCSAFLLRIETYIGGTYTPLQHRVSWGVGSRSWSSVGLWSCLRSRHPRLSHPRVSHWTIGVMGAHPPHGIPSSGEDPKLSVITYPLEKLNTSRKNSQPLNFQSWDEESCTTSTNLHTNSFYLANGITIGFTALTACTAPVRHHDASSKNARKCGYHKAMVLSRFFWLASLHVRGKPLLTQYCY